MTHTSVSHYGTVLLVLLLLGGLGGRVSAQSNGGASASIALQDAPLDRALEQVATDAGISLVYDFALVEDRRASCTAREAAPKLLLRCLLDGHPIDYVRTSKGTFVLQEAVQRPPQRGHLTGIVRGAKRGRPLVNAHIRLPEVRELTGTVTDSTGRFRLTGLLPGPHSVVVTHLGYEPHRATVYVPSNGSAHHDATLAPAPIAVDSLVIDADRFVPSSAQSRDERVSTAQLLRASVAGTPDVFTAASTLIGVTTSPPYADLHIQGSDTGGHTLRLDGVPIRNPASAGRLLSAFSPLALDGLTARKAGFGALRGNALSGTVELSHDLSDRGAQYGTVQVDSRSLNARLRGTTTLGTTPVTAMIAGRVSVWGVHQEAALHDLVDRWSTLDPVLVTAQMPADTSLAGGSLGARAQPDAGFYDLHGAARFDLGPAKQLSMSAYHGGSHLGADLVLGRTAGQTSNLNFEDATPDASAFVLPTHDEYSWTNTAAQVRYSAPVTPRAVGTLRASVSHYEGETQSEIGSVQPSLQAEYGSMMTALRQAAYGQEGANEVAELDVEGRLDVSFSARNGLVLTAGGTYQGSRFRIGNAFAPQLRHRARTARLTTAAEATVGLGPHTTLESGVRMTALPFQARLFAEPRGGLRYDRSIDGLGRVALDVRGGLYRKFTSQFELNRDGATAVVPTTPVWLPMTSSMRPSRTYHLAADLTWQPESLRKWRVDLEGYRKWQPHLLAVNYPALRDHSTVLDGTSDPSRFLGSSRGYVYGGGLHVKYEGSSVTGSLRYAYSRARRTFPGRFDGRLAPVPWADPHRLMLDLELPLGSGVALETRGKGVWGRRWGYRRAYYAYLTPSDLGEEWNRLRMGRPGTHVLPPLYRLDTGLTVAQSWSGVHVEGRIGIVNVLDRDNVADWSLRPKRNGDVSRWARPLPGRRAAVSIQVRY